MIKRKQLTGHRARLGRRNLIVVSLVIYATKFFNAFFCYAHATKYQF
jgi:hypothetical protein